MTFDELTDTLPNGFHDSELNRLEMDYLTRKLVFDVLVFTGGVDNPQKVQMYRPARVTVENVAYLVIEPPDPREPPDPSYPWVEAGGISFDTGEGQPSQSASILPTAPEGTTVTWMYLYDFNRFLLFAAGDATLEWTGPEEDRN